MGEPHHTVWHRTHSTTQHRTPHCTAPRYTTRHITSHHTTQHHTTPQHSAPPTCRGDPCRPWQRRGEVAAGASSTSPLGASQLGSIRSSPDAEVKRVQHQPGGANFNVAFIILPHNSIRTSRITSFNTACLFSPYLCLFLIISRYPKIYLCCVHTLISLLLSL